MKINYLEQLKRLNLPKDKFAIFGSGPLAVRGIRKSDDIDIIVKKELWHKLSEKYNKTNEEIIKIGNIEIYKEWKPWVKDNDDLIDSADVFDEIRFVKLEDVLGWKKKYNRPKDLKDIELIENFMKLNSF
jgi:hypothetical protein